MSISKEVHLNYIKPDFVFDAETAELSDNPIQNAFERDALLQRQKELCGEYYGDPNGLLDRAWKAYQNAPADDKYNALEMERKSNAARLFVLERNFAALAISDKSIPIEAITTSNPSTIQNSLCDRVEIISNLKVNESSDIIGVFQTQVNNHPYQIVTYNGESFTYLELDQRSNQIAHFLVDYCSVSCGDMIAIIGSNKLEMLICELAILKSGGVFIPFDPSIPAERLNLSLNAANVKLTIACDQQITQSVAGNVIHLAENANQIAEHSSSGLSQTGSKGSSLAYILYTSGSTSATPKGVMQTRCGLLGQIQNYTHDLKITDEDNFLQLAPMTHDQAIVDTFGALLNGATLHFYDMDLYTLNTPNLQKLIADRKISIFSSIPSVFSLIFEDVENDHCFPDLRIVTLGGEEVKIDHVRLYQKIAQPHCLFINGYGATEFSWLSYYIIAKNTNLDQMAQIPLGQLAPKTEMVLNLNKGKPDQGIGELCVHSPFMSPGYWGDQEATNKAFFECDGKVYYRTGDLASVDAQGILHFKGRLKWHAKVNGKRVCLKEIEDQMRIAMPLEECVVIPHGNEDTSLYAFYTVKKGEKINETIGEIRNKLKPNLPKHAIPYKFYAIDKFPFLHNGKVDRQSLTKKIDLEIQEATNNRNLNEMHPVDAAFCEVFNLSEPLGDAFNYWDAGMDSMHFNLFTKKLNQQLSFIENLYIDVLELIDTKTVSEIKKISENKIKKLKEKGLEELPKYSQKPVRIKYENQYGSEYFDDNHKMLKINFASMKILSEYYNEKYKINIIPCASYLQFASELKTFINNGSPGQQLGLTWPNNNYKEAHPTPCICRINENQQVSLTVSDSLGEFPEGMEKELENYGLKNQIQFHSAPQMQQMDYGSCAVLAIAYLKDGLRLDMSEVTAETNDGWSGLKSDFHLSYGPKYIPKSVRCFQNPPDLLKHVQSPFPSYMFKVDLNTPLKTSKNQKTLAQYREKHCAPTKPSRVTSYATSNPKVPELQNNSLYIKGEKYKKILDVYIEKYRQLQNNTPKTNTLS